MYVLKGATRARVSELCRRYTVRRLDLVGSGARRDFDPATSDLDLLVEFVDQPSMHSYFGLKDELEAALGRPVDLIMPAAVSNPFVRAHMERDRANMYAT